MSQIKIRKAVLNDLATLLEFEQAIIEYERPMEELMQTEKFNYYDLKELIADDSAEVLVAELDGQLIGSGFARLKESRHYLRDGYHAYLGFMYIDPNHRGKGVNQLIVKKLIDWSKNKGMKSVCLTVFEDNEAAIKAYNKVGFRKQFVEMRYNFDD